MKKITLSLLAVAFMCAFSGCTKEQTTLNILHGTWKLTGELDEDGLPVVRSCTQEEIVTFFLCQDKNQDDCTTSTKVTRTCTTGGTTVTTISAGASNYAVYGKELLVWDGASYEIESISKKEFKIHPVSQPKATHTYEKQ
ncbi:MAG TPA: hypothetical protein VK154_04475 [Chitinophagales bacterium]|nr:hypothetical protein [Chitinophagales bacterium]